MKVRIINHDVYGPFFMGADPEIFGVGTVHEVRAFYPDTGEVDLGYEDERLTFAPSEYEVVEEGEV